MSARQNASSIKSSLFQKNYCFFLNEKNSLIFYTNFFIFSAYFLSDLLLIYQRMLWLHWQVKVFKICYKRRMEWVLLVRIEIWIRLVLVKWVYWVCHNWRTCCPFPNPNLTQPNQNWLKSKLRLKVGKQREIGSVE